MAGGIAWRIPPFSRRGDGLRESRLRKSAHVQGLGMPASETLHKSGHTWFGPDPINSGRIDQARREHHAKWHLLSHGLAQSRV